MIEESVLLQLSYDRELDLDKFVGRFLGELVTEEDVQLPLSVLYAKINLRKLLKSELYKELEGTELERKNHEIMGMIRGG